MDRLYFTQRGLAKLHKKIKMLEEKLQDLQSQTAYVAEVGGDQWHDNFGYEALVIELRGIDRQLAEAHQELRNAILVDPPTSFNEVAIGTRVKIMCDGEEMTWEIVGYGESDPDNGMIAYNTPLASLIMGKQKGEVVIGIIAGKKTKIEILEITKGGKENDHNS
jgi:transcription elongation factor GreA